VFFNIDFNRIISKIKKIRNLKYFQTKNIFKKISCITFMSKLLILETMSWICCFVFNLTLNKDLIERFVVLFLGSLFSPYNHLSTLLTRSTKLSNFDPLDPHRPTSREGPSRTLSIHDMKTIVKNFIFISLVQNPFHSAPTRWSQLI
jgi:hypothetical protein